MSRIKSITLSSCVQNNFIAILSCVQNNIEIDFYVPDEKLAIQVSMLVLDDPDTKERETRAFVKLNNYTPEMNYLRNATKRKRVS